MTMANEWDHRSLKYWHPLFETRYMDMLTQIENLGPTI